MAAGAAAGVGVASAYVTGSNAVAGAKYQEAILNKNASMTEMQAERVLKKGQKDALNFKKQVKQTIGSQRAAMAAQGIDVNDGDALDIQTETADIGAQDALTIQNNAFLEAMGLKSQAVDMRWQGRFGVMSAQTQMKTSMITGGMNGYMAGGGFSGGGGAKPTTTGGSMTTAGSSYKNYGNMA